VAEEYQRVGASTAAVDLVRAMMVCFTANDYPSTSTFMPRRTNSASRERCTRAQTDRIDVDQLARPFARQACGEHRIDVVGVA
jgi:hypothetical protein